MSQLYQDNLQFYLDEDEVWEYIPHFHGYKVSNKGRIYSVNKDRIIRRGKHNIVSIYNESNSSKSFSIQTLMACTYLGLDIEDPFRNRVLFRDGNSNNLVLGNIYVEDTSDLPGEMWKRLSYAAGHELMDYYEISNMGRVKSIKHSVTFSNHGKIVTKPCPELMISCIANDHGYKFAYLACKDGGDVNAQVHRLVATAFCANDNPDIKTVVNHIDGDTSNNYATNLEWCTDAENAQHAVRMGLRGSWSGRKLRYTVLHVEKDKLYNSLSDVDRALGRNIGYCAERLKFGKPITDRDGNIWTLEVFRDIQRKISVDGQHCTLDEFPGKEFISLSEASLAIGRWDGYISDCLKRCSPIKNKAGQVMHIHLIGDAPVVSANEAYKEKKAKGLVKPRKEAKYLSKSNVHRALKRIETGEIYASMSAVDRAMGRPAGYVSECFAYDRTMTDRDGNTWTFEILEEGSVTLHYKKNPCFFDELPGQEFANRTEAAQAIGRNDSYITDRISAKKPILNKEGQLMHFHYADPSKEQKLQETYYRVVDLSAASKQKNLFNINPNLES